MRRGDHVLITLRRLGRRRVYRLTLLLCGPECKARVQVEKGVGV